MREPFDWIRDCSTADALGREDFLQYFNSNADGTDRSQDDAIGKPQSCPRAQCADLIFSRQPRGPYVPGRGLLSQRALCGLHGGGSANRIRHTHEGIPFS